MEIIMLWFYPPIQLSLVRANILHQWTLASSKHFPVIDVEILGDFFSFRQIVIIIIIRILESTETERVHRYLRAPPFSVADYIQFVTDEKEVEQIVFDTDANGQNWIYHASFSPMHQKTDISTLLWGMFFGYLHINHF